MIGPMADPLKGAEEDQLCFTVQWLNGGEPVPNVQTDMQFFPRMSYTLEEVVTLVEHTGCGSGRLQGAHICVRMLEDPADAITDRPVGLYPRPKDPCGPLAVPEPSVAAPGGFHRSADTGRPSDDYQDKPIEPVEDFTKMDTEAMFSPGSSPDDCIADVAHSPSSPVPITDHDGMPLCLPWEDPSIAPLTDQERADIAELAGRIHDRLLNSRRLHSSESQASDYMASWWTTLLYITTVLHAVPPPVTVHRPGSVAGPADSMRSATPSPNEEMLRTWN